jgi:hypothetical protein
MINKYAKYANLDSVSQKCIDDTEEARLRRARYFAQQAPRKPTLRKNNLDGEILKAREARRNR